MAQLLHLTGQALRDSTGAPYLSAKAYFYETGTTTPKNTYSDAGLTSANTNPVIADGTTGFFPDIYLLAGRYKVVLQQSDGTSIHTWDPLDGTSQIFTATAAPSPTYPFLRYHNSTDGHVYRRNAANSAWIDEGLVDSLLNAATVTEQLAGTEAAKSSTPDSVAALWQRGTDIASASTLSLPSTGGAVFNVTGTTGVSGISSAAGGRAIILEFAGALTLTHNSTSFDLPGNANITTAAGDRACFVNLAAQDATGSNWRCLWYTRDDGSYAGVVATQAQLETPTNNTFPVTPLRVQNHPGVAKAWVSFVTRGTNGACTINASHNVSGVSRTATGTYQVTFITAMSSSTYAVMGTAETAIGTNSLITSGSKATTTCNVLSQSAGSGAALDSGNIDAFFFGDQ